MLHYINLQVQPPLPIRYYAKEGIKFAHMAHSFVFPLLVRTHQVDDDDLCELGADSTGHGSSDVHIGEETSRVGNNLVKLEAAGRASVGGGAGGVDTSDERSSQAAR